MSAEPAPPQLPGTFGWNELLTDDPVAAEKFYHALFGWTVQQKDIGQGMIYNLFMQGDKPVAGMLQITPDMPGARPSWMSYVNVENMAERCAAVEASGGRLLFPPKEIPHVGKLTAIMDPGGAVVCLWQGLG